MSGPCPGRPGWSARNCRTPVPASWGPGRPPEAGTVRPAPASPDRVGGELMTTRIVAVNRGAESAGDAPPAGRRPGLDALEAWVGRWINQGRMIDAAGTAITTSDVYEWA